MPDNIVCYTQDIPGEREWINSHFPGFINLETESSGKWNCIVNNKTIREIPFTDPCTVDLTSTKKIKTVYSNKLDLVIHDNMILLADELLINKDINFLNSTNPVVNKYMMFTFTRCGTVFTESILQKKYPAVQSHYGYVGHNKKEIVNMCSSDDIRICLNYRSNWWNWITSYAIAEANRHMTERGVLHYFDNVDWKSVVPTKITDDLFTKCEHYINSTFCFWCQLRLCLPNHTFSLFRFEDILPLYKNKTDHAQNPYDKTKLIIDYADTEQLFKERYLARWQAIEQKTLRFLKQMNVVPTTIL
jgi:hypothetical protein